MLFYSSFSNLTASHNLWQNGRRCRSALTILTGTPTGKRPLRRPRRRWEDSIRMYLKEMDVITRSLVDLAQDAANELCNVKYV